MTVVKLSQWPSGGLKTLASANPQWSSVAEYALKPLRLKGDPNPCSGIINCYDESGRFCSFSPCIEQVQRTCLALQECGFQELSTMEVLQSELKVTRRTVPVRDLSFLKHKSSERPVEEKPSGETSYVVGAWPASTPGHTGYLTVATLPPLFARIKRNTAKEETSCDETTITKSSENGGTATIDNFV